MNDKKTPAQIALEAQVRRARYDLKAGVKGGRNWMTGWVEAG